jgi:hypothetical protein
VAAAEGPTETTPPPGPADTTPPPGPADATPPPGPAEARPPPGPDVGTEPPGSAPDRPGSGAGRTSDPPDDVPTTGPGDAGGKTGISNVSDFPPASSFDPAVIAAAVGTDASNTSNATISTYRRVGPEKPESAR